MDTLDQQPQSPQPMPQVPQAEPPTQPHFSFKPVYLLLIIILILLVGGGAYYINNQYKTAVVPSPIVTSFPQSTSINETANWKTYVSTKFSFSLKYPNKLTIKDSTDVTIFSNPEDTSEFPNNIMVRVLDNDKTQDSVLEKYFTVQGKNWQEIQIGAYKGSYIEATGGTLSGLAATLKHPSKFFIFQLADRENQDYITNQDFFQILSTFTLLNQNTSDSNSNTSPDGSYYVIEEHLGDYNKIAIYTKENKGITTDLIAENGQEIGYGVKFQCQCGTSFKQWTNDTIFSIKIVNANGEEFEFNVDAATGKVDEDSFKKIK